MTKNKKGSTVAICDRAAFLNEYCDIHAAKVIHQTAQK